MFAKLIFVVTCKIPPRRFNGLFAREVVVYAIYGAKNTDPKNVVCIKIESLRKK